MSTRYNTVIGILLVTLLASGVVYFTWSDEGIKIRVDVDKTTYYLKNDDNRYLVEAREYNSLWDFPSKMNRDLKNTYTTTVTNNMTNISVVTRHTQYKRGPVVKDTYIIDGNIVDVEKFPKSHKIEVYNGSGFTYQYEVRDLKYSGETIKNIKSPVQIGRIKIEFEDSYWNTLYKSGVLKVRYKLDSDYEVFYNRVIDPIIGKNDTKIIHPNMTIYNPHKSVPMSNTYDLNFSKAKIKSYSYPINDSCVAYNDNYKITILDCHQVKDFGSEYDYEFLIENHDSKTHNINIMISSTDGFESVNYNEFHQKDRVSLTPIKIGTNLVNGKGDTFYDLKTRFRVLPKTILNHTYTFTPSRKTGKFNIFLFDEKYTLDEAIKSNDYVLLDPSWSSTELKAFYRMDGNAGDYSGNENNGTVSGPVLTTDKDGNSSCAYFFDGSNDQINIANDASIQLSASFSVSLWFKRNSIQTGMRLLVGKGATINDENYFLSFNGNKIYGYFANTAGSWQAVPLSTNTITETTDWHHWVMVYNTTANNITHYMDKVEWTSGIVSGTPRTGAYKMSIGSSSDNNRYFSGNIDEVAIFNFALNTTAISDIYDDGINPPSPPSNIAPYIESSSAEPTTAYTDTDITVYIECSDANAGDTLTANMQPYLNNAIDETEKNKVVTNSTNTSIYTYASGNFSKDNTVKFELWCGDGTVNTTKSNTSEITILNSVPTVPAKIGIPGGLVGTNDNIVCLANGSTDADSDSISYYYKFNDTALLRDWSTNATYSCELPGCDAGDTVYCHAKAVTSDANSTHITASKSIYSPTSNYSTITVETPIELGSNATIWANNTNGGTICIDIDHPDYGVNVSCGTPNTTLIWNISYFRRTELSQLIPDNHSFHQEENYTDGGSEGHAYYYYDRPVESGRSEVGAYFQVKHGTFPTYNISVPSGCLDYVNAGYPNRLYIQIRSRGNLYQDIAETYLRCYDIDSGWITFGTRDWTTITSTATKSGISEGPLFDEDYDTYSAFHWTDAGFADDWYSTYSHKQARVYDADLYWIFNWTYTADADSLNVTYPTWENKSIAITAHQYDEVIGLQVDMSGHEYLNDWPTEVKIYVAGELSNSVGSLFNTTSFRLDEIDDDAETKNYTFSSYPTATATSAYFRLPKTANITNAVFNLTGRLSNDLYPVLTNGTEMIASTTGGAWVDPTYTYDEDIDTYGYISIDQFENTGNNYLYQNFTLLDYTSNINVTWKVALSGTGYAGIGWHILTCYDGSSWDMIQASSSSVYDGEYIFTRAIPTDCLDDGNGVVQLRSSLSAITPNAGETAEVRDYETNITYWNVTYPTNVGVEVGVVDGSKEFSQAGAHSTTNITTNFSDEIIAYLQTCTADDDGFCNVPVLIIASAGIETISDIEIDYLYETSSIQLNTALIQEAVDNLNDSGQIILTIESKTPGIIELSNLQYDYAGGNDTINITAHLVDYSDNETINATLHYSHWDYIFPDYISYMEFIPLTPTSKGVMPYGQSIEDPILNITGRNYGGLDFDFYVKNNETYSCVNLTVNSTFVKPNADKSLNTTFQTTYNNVSYGESFSQYLWADYDCSFTSWKLWEPELFFVACCKGCNCTVN